LQRTAPLPLACLPSRLPFIKRVLLLLVVLVVLVLVLMGRAAKKNWMLRLICTSNKGTQKWFEQNAKARAVINGEKDRQIAMSLRASGVELGKNWDPVTKFCEPFSFDAAGGGGRAKNTNKGDDKLAISEVGGGGSSGDANADGANADDTNDADNTDLSDPRRAYNAHKKIRDAASEKKAFEEEEARREKNAALRTKVQDIGKKARREDWLLQRLGRNKEAPILVFEVTNSSGMKDRLQVWESDDIEAVGAAYADLNDLNEDGKNELIECLIANVAHAKNETAKKKGEIDFDSAAAGLNRNDFEIGVEELGSDSSASSSIADDDEVTQSKGMDELRGDEEEEEEIEVEVRDRGQKQRQQQREKEQQRVIVVEGEGKGENNNSGNSTDDGKSEETNSNGDDLEMFFEDL
jgi:hypothetical protein